MSTMKSHAQHIAKELERLSKEQNIAQDELDDSRSQGCYMQGMADLRLERVTEEYEATVEDARQMIAETLEIKTILAKALRK